ncbi:hypothetical protein OG413_40980 [Streptomyces sp. NBC_01433]|uniref:hypothetical protein n=1 Tax=Streptomyces sp. NBC_01433 TaxID=2903864 RepID=UPI002258D931|nr:hypothetical protein [Streptomyces sp. NBC_01433]MCX4681578.1 hypothetical protein [Streptomyces sp. NBC_01433]
MPTHATPPGSAAQPGTTYRSVPEGDPPRGFVRGRRPLRLVPDLGEYDPAEDRIREQLLAMGVHPGGRS